MLLAMPENISLERRRILEAYGAELILTNSREGADGAIRMARKLYSESPETYFYPDQYSNPANWQAHYNLPAWKSISRQADGSPILLQGWVPAGHLPDVEDVSRN